MPCGCNPMKANICRICNKKVNKKKGMQCEGICQRWIHYKCLKLCCCVEEDIKKGFIKIRCPCSECKTDTSSDRIEPLSTPPCCSASALSKLHAEPPSTVSQYQSGTTSHRVNDLDECRSDRFDLPSTPEKCPTCSPKKPKTTPSLSTCSALSNKSTHSRSRRPCPTPNDCDVKEVCNKVSEITDEIDILMKRLKTLLEHQEACLDQKCYRKYK